MSNLSHSTSSAKAQYDLVFICAMEEEIRSLALQRTEETIYTEDLKEDLKVLMKEKGYQIGSTKFFEFEIPTEIDGLTVYVKCLACITGIGKTLAAVGFERLCNHVDFVAAINLGTCGAVDSQSSSEQVFIAESTCYGDVDLTGFSYLYGQYPAMQANFFQCPPKFSRTIYERSLELGLKCDYGRIITTDSFIDSTEKKDYIVKSLTNAASLYNENVLQDPTLDLPRFLAFDMECAALAQIAQENGKTLLIIKQVSDSADSSASEDFNVSIQNTCNFATTVIMENLSYIYKGIKVKQKKLQESRQQ